MCLSCWKYLCYRVSQLPVSEDSFLLPAAVLCLFGQYADRQCNIGGIIACVRGLFHLVVAFQILQPGGFENRHRFQAGIQPRLGIVPGDEGLTLSRLAPIGKARINGITVEAKSMDELIDENTPVEVIRVDGYNVIVKIKN